MPKSQQPRCAENRKRTIFTALLTVLVLLPLARSPARATEEPHAREFVFEELNRVYPDLSFQGPPLGWGPLRMQLQSPRFTVLVFRHKVKAHALDGGRHRVAAEVELSAHGRLVVDLEVAGAATRREGDAAAPRQVLAVDGVVTVERKESGYAVTVVELPPSLEVEVHSALSEGLGAWCRENAMLRLAGADCEAMERRLTRIAVPLPRPGERFWLDRSRLPETYAAELDEYLNAAAER